MEQIEKTLLDRASDYYRGERISNSLLFVTGMGAMIWTLFVFLWRQGHLSTGVFYSTFPLALFFLITGAYRFIRSMSRYNTITEHTSPQDYITSVEKEHLLGRGARFRQKRKVDAVGVIVGFMIIALSLAFSWNHILMGTGVSIIFASGLLLIFDLFGQFRTEEFLHHIQKR